MTKLLLKIYSFFIKSDAKYCHFIGSQALAVSLFIFSEIRSFKKTGRLRTTLGFAECRQQMHSAGRPAGSM